MKKKQIIIGAAGLLCMLFLIGAVYLLTHGDNLPADAADENTGQELADLDTDQEHNIILLTPTPVLDKPFIMAAEDIINSKPVGGEKDQKPEVTETPAEEVNGASEEGPQEDQLPETSQDDNDQDTVSGQTDAEVASDQEDTKVEEAVVVDESPETVKEDKVNEYTGGEKTGTGYDFMDLMPDKMPKSGPEIDGDVPASGVEVGTWN